MSNKCYLQGQLSWSWRDTTCAVGGYLDRVHVLARGSGEQILGDTIHEILHLHAGEGLMSIIHNSRHRTCPHMF